MYEKKRHEVTDRPLINHTVNISMTKRSSKHTECNKKKCTDDSKVNTHIFLL